MIADSFSTPSTKPRLINQKVAKAANYTPGKRVVYLAKFSNHSTLDYYRRGPFSNTEHEVDRRFRTRDAENSTRSESLRVPACR